MLEESEKLGGVGVGRGVENTEGIKGLREVIRVVGFKAVGGTIRVGSTIGVGREGGFEGVVGRGGMEELDASKELSEWGRLTKSGR